MAVKGRSLLVSASIAVVGAFLTTAMLTASLDDAPRTMGVYPAAPVVPSNLLRFYIEFSAPMESGEAYRHIQLFDASGNRVTGAFLELDEELWDPAQRRFTLLFDPGRIKRGLRSNVEMGAPLGQGERYRLVIDSMWRAADGRMLVSSYMQEFAVGPFDDRAPALDRWRISRPGAGTREPLTITFDEPLDHALAGRLLQLERASGANIPGVPRLEDGDSSWTFTPTEPWRAGELTLRVGTALADLAGNTLATVFDVDLRRGDRSHDAASLGSVTRSLLIDR